MLKCLLGQWENSLLSAWLLETWWECCPCCRLSLAELALGSATAERAPWGGFYPVPLAPCSPSPYLDWGSVEMCSPLPLGWCTCVSPPSLFLLRQKNKKSCGIMEGLLSFLSFGVASSPAVFATEHWNTANSTWMFLTLWTCKRRNISNTVREGKKP